MSKYGVFSGPYFPAFGLKKTQSIFKVFVKRETDILKEKQDKREKTNRRLSTKRWHSWEMQTLCKCCIYVLFVFTCYFNVTKYWYWYQDVFGLFLFLINQEFPKRNEHNLAQNVVKLFARLYVVATRTSTSVVVSVFFCNIWF